MTCCWRVGSKELILEDLSVGESSFLLAYFFLLFLFNAFNYNETSIPKINIIVKYKLLSLDL